jgi:HSP20 family protein
MSKESISLLPEIFNKPLRDFPNLMQKFFTSPLTGFMGEDLQSGSKGVRVYEENNHLHVEAPMPGLDAKDIDVKIHNGILFINGECKRQENNKNKKIYSSSVRKYSYSIALPDQIDETKQREASYADGILNISFPISTKEKAKKIPVKAKSQSKSGSPAKTQKKR